MQLDDFIKIMQTTMEESKNQDEEEEVDEDPSHDEYLVHAFAMFDRKVSTNLPKHKGYISKDDLKEVFALLGEKVTDEQLLSKHT